MFVQCFVTILYVAAWVGAWENFDILFDEIIFDGDLVASNYVALAVGALGGATMTLLQVEIKQLAESANM